MDLNVSEIGPWFYLAEGEVNNKNKEKGKRKEKKKEKRGRKVPKH